MKSRTRAVIVMALTSFLVLTFGGSPSTAAVTTDERTTIPVGGSFTVSGRGYGHGTGMSQFGAQGQALAGRSAAQILSFYYPGTSATTISNTDMRVWLTGDTDNSVEVVAEAGMTVSDAANGSRSITTGDWAKATRWRITRDSSGLILHGQVGGTWKRWSSSASASWLRITAPDRTLTLVLPGGGTQQYRGSIGAVVDGSSPTLKTVNWVPMEDYLRSVVPAEVYTSWHSATLQAQSVAARTYAAFERNANRSRAWDICDSTQCQVYKGVGAEVPQTDSAIKATAGQIRTYQGAPAFTQFSSSNGGWTTAGRFAYLTAKEDPWDDDVNPNATWSVTVTAAKLQSAFPDAGTPTGVTVVTRTGNGTWGGRVAEVKITGTSSTVTTTGSTFASRLGLKSSWWKITSTTPGPVKATRLAGPDRYATSVEISKKFSPGVPVVYVATGSDFPDALSAAPAAAAAGGPLLLTARTALPSTVRAEIVRLKPARIVVVGGTGAVSAKVYDELAKLTGSIRRDAGPDRYATSRIVNERAFGHGAQTAFVVTGADFPDALSAAAAAGSLPAPVILVPGNAPSIDTATSRMLRTLKVSTVRIVGGTGVVSSRLENSLRSTVSTVVRHAGADRYATSAAINKAVFDTAPTAYLANGLGFADALAGAALAARDNAPLLVTRQTCIPASVSSQLAAWRTTTHVALGGNAVVSNAAAQGAVCR